MLELIIYLSIIFIYILLAFIIAMLIQGVVYWLTGFSIYNWLSKKLLK